jgi:hypothetical protein
LNCAWHGTSRHPTGAAKRPKAKPFSAKLFLNCFARHGFAFKRSSEN